MDNCHNYATTSKKRRIPISDDIHIIIKKFRDKDKHDEKPSTSGDHDYDDEHSMDSEELRRVRQQEPSSSCVAASTSSSNSNSGTMNNVMGTIMAGGTGITIGTGGIAIQQQQQQPVSSQSDDIKLILKKLTNIEELLKVVAEQSFNRLAALKQEATGATTVVPTTAANLGLLAEPNCISMEANFKFPLRTLKELIELNKGICSDESLYNKLFEYLTKIKLECDENIVMNALAMIVSDEVLDAVTWDGGKKFKLSSLVIFSDSLYVAWFKDRLKYDEYVAEMKDAIDKSHKRFAKMKTKKISQQQQQHQTLTLTTATGATVASDGQIFLS
ncbi:AAEL014698-PA [Aedes aegypti]|uniref:AAEL014698-PA n=2 Tax=Aedes aegypti TaxID=7159 RepID=A6KWA4_AEDAE|nr:uncharacterized protein LOC5565020 [Aedes aegypti]EAT33047.1 AAEL014698-PB [Aedes aegypti]EAT33048.1 AAEL014698-PA [Aedes aegypti]